MTAIFTISVLSIPDRWTPLGQRVTDVGTSSASSLPWVGATAPSARCPGARTGLRFYVASAQRWRAQRDARPLPVGNAGRSPSCAYVRWAADLWRNRAGKAKVAFRAWFAHTYAKYECVHRREAAWNDQHAPHYGGLQFDDDFQRTYGPAFFARWGDAGNWPVWSQLLAAERAFHGWRGIRGRGWVPWPNTARACGLL